MDNGFPVTMVNMCMIEDEEGRVLVQHRLPKPTNPWCGLTFPGGHVEAGESIAASTVREVREETGLTVSGLRNCGYVEWWNPEKQSLYIVFLLKACHFEGILRSSSEGEMTWMTLEEMRAGSMAPNMDKYLRVFLEDDVVECRGISGGELTVVK